MKILFVAFGLFTLSVVPSRAGEVLDQLSGLTGIQSAQVPAILSAPVAVSSQAWTSWEAADYLASQTRKIDTKSLRGNWKRIGRIVLPEPTGVIDMAGLDVDGEAGRITISAKDTPLQEHIVYAAVQGLNTVPTRMHNFTESQTRITVYITSAKTPKTPGDALTMFFSCAQGDDILLCDVTVNPYPNGKYTAIVAYQREK